MQTFFSRSPWERPSVLSLRSPQLGQVAPGCEPTPEGGYRCPDGTYLPPGCKPGSGNSISASAPTPGGNLPLIIGGLAAVAGAGYLLLAGHKHRMGAEPTTFESSYPEVFGQLSSIADKINGERANDAYFFGKYIEASKARQDLALAEITAQQTLAAQEKIWNATHNNAAEYQAAQAALDKISADKGQALQDMQTNRDGINQAAQNILSLRSNAEAIVSQLPSDTQSQAWRLIDPCAFKAPGMSGRRLGQNYSWNGWGDQSGHDFGANPYGSMTPEQRTLQEAQRSMNEPPPPTPEQNLLRQAQESIGQDCYTCVNGGDIQTGVNAATAASLKAQGYRCRKDECAQRGQYGAGTYNGYNPFGNPMTTAAPQSNINQNYGSDQYNYQMMEGRRRYRVVNT